KQVVHGARRERAHELATAERLALGATAARARRAGRIARTDEALERLARFLLDAQVVEPEAPLRARPELAQPVAARQARLKAARILGRRRRCRQAPGEEEERACQQSHEITSEARGR